MKLILSSDLERSGRGPDLSPPLLVRALRSQTSDTLSRWWNGGDPYATAIYNALSLTFPLGEPFFIQSVVEFVEEAPEPLRAQILKFSDQEANHTREHLAFNRQVELAGYDVRSHDDALRESLVRMRRTDPLICLTLTVALEHFTAIIAHEMLARSHYLARAPEAVRRLWIWHAVEEVEHKAVAYDTFLWVTRDMSPLRRWKLRCKVMLHATRAFGLGRWRVMRAMLAQDGEIGFISQLRILWSMFGSPGLYQRIIWPWLSFFRPGFHPWSIDDRALLQVGERALQAAP